ncbi:hypothetical protein [Gordonia sp. ABSL49_1]|uniref:hypothetical protein n=1 Tax=Gordonia sp. ABSL49_1 TaxID=2920941 RepID=UPI001F0E9232|nr:hypothetical protein [Gordonia sp. ABSL49_1]MCH5642648.1 hypothetical protein [Gordonia sp. ABSL49_1]
MTEIGPVSVGFRHIPEDPAAGPDLSHPTRRPLDSGKSCRPQSRLVGMSQLQKPRVWSETRAHQRFLATPKVSGDDCGFGDGATLSTIADDVGGWVADPKSW